MSNITSTNELILTSALVKNKEGIKEMFLQHINAVYNMKGKKAFLPDRKKLNAFIATLKPDSEVINNLNVILLAIKLEEMGRLKSYLDQWTSTTADALANKTIVTLRKVIAVTDIIESNVLIDASFNRLLGDSIAEKERKEKEEEEEGEKKEKETKEKEAKK